MTLFPDDLALAKAVLRGDVLAFDRFYRTFFPRVYRFLCSRTCEHAIAEELCQASLVRAIERLDQYRGEAALLTWLLTIARNEQIARARQVQRFVPIGEQAHESLTQYAPTSVDPEMQAQHEQTRTLVHRILDQLPSLYADCLEWKYALGLSMQEIAKRLGRTEKAVEGLLSRARAEFKALARSGTPVLP